ncbi:unnamed protein product [Closterium sp. NIES-53]
MRYVWVVKVEARNRGYEVFRLWLAHAQRQSGEKPKIWQSDGEGIQEQGAAGLLGAEGDRAPHFPPLGAPVARRSRVHEPHAYDKGAGADEAIKAPANILDLRNAPRVRVHNLLSTTAITGNLSPHLKWTGTKGDTSMLRVWGCMVQYRLPMSTIRKFASRARLGIHLGISHEHKAWLVLDLMSQKVANAHDVIF